MHSSACAALVISLSACGGQSHPLASSAGGGTDAGIETGVAARRCIFQGFAPSVAYPAANEPVSIVPVDRKRNGHLDLLVGERGIGGRKSELLVNAGDGTFVASASYGASDNNAGNLVTADFNGDGRLDLASQWNGADGIDLDLGDGVLGIDLGTSGGGFAPRVVSQATPQTTGDLAVGDFDGDGHPDLAFAGYDYVEAGVGPGAVDGTRALPAPEPTHFALNVFFNSGDGTFATPAAQTIATAIGFQTGFSNLVTGDFDGDGRLDLAGLVGWSFGVFFNAGGRTLRDEVTFVAGDGWIDYGLAVADFNGDGRDDVATTTILDVNTAAQKIVLEVFEGTSRSTFDGPLTYPIDVVPSVYRIVAGDFTGDGKPDLAMVQGRSAQGAPLTPIPVAVFGNRGDGTFASPTTYVFGGGDVGGATAIAAGDLNGDGVSDLAVATVGEAPPYPVAVNVRLSKCAPEGN